MPASPPSRPQPNSRASALVLKGSKGKQPHGHQSRFPTLAQRLLNGVAIAALLTGASTLAGLGLWAGAVLVFRPNPPQWLVTHLPYWSKGWGDIPIQTLAEIEADLKVQKQRPGDLINLKSVSADVQLDGLYLLPVLTTRSPCAQDCDIISEVRLYGVHHREKKTLHLQQLSQLTIQGPLEEQILDPVSLKDVGTLGSAYPLPLVDLKPLQEEPLPGGWFALTGRWQNQGSPILYGQLLHVDPQSLSVNSVLNWKSPVGRLPAWLNLDQQGLPELVVNQSVGLEPHYRLYTVTNLTAAHISTRLREISLRRLPLPQEISAVAYRNALFLAQHGLWSDAERILTPLKQQLSQQQWTLELEQQFQLIMLHARHSRTQAEREWSQPSQQLLALLLDGQWTKALQTVKSSRTGYDRAVLPLLKRDSSRLWPRLTASLQVNPHQEDARLWGALLLLTKQDEKSALQWLTRDQNSPLRKEFQAIAAQVSPPSLEQPSTAATVSSRHVAQPAGNPAASGVSAFWGTAYFQTGLNPDEWFSPYPNGARDLSSGYVIPLEWGYQNQQWSSQLGTPRDTSSAAIAVYLQSLGLDSFYTLQLVSLTAGQPTHLVRVKGVKWQGGAVQLLAEGADLQEPLVAVKPGQWVSPRMVPAQPLLQIFQSKPEVSNRLISTLKDHLGFSATTFLSTLQKASTLGTDAASYQQINVPGHAEPALLLTLSAAVAAQAGVALAEGASVRMILNTQGELLYSTLWGGEAEQLVGWLQWPAGENALVIRQGDRPILKTWSSAQGRFQ